MKTKNFVILAFATCSIALTACQQSPSKRQGQKSRVTNKTRTTQKFNFQNNEAANKARTEAITAAGGTQAPTDEEREAAKPQAETADTTNALCNAGSENTCNALRVSLLEKGKLDGIDRQEASNAGKAHTVTSAEVKTTDKKIEVSIDLKVSDNKNAKLLIVAAESATVSYAAKLRTIKLENVEFKILDKDPSAQELTDMKNIVNEFDGKILLIAPVQSTITSMTTKLAISKAKLKTLVSPKNMTANQLIEESLALIGGVVPVNFVTPHAVSLVDTDSLVVRLDDKKLIVGTDFGIDSAKTATLRIFMIKRSLMTAESKLKITYNLK